ncbi:MAG: hypothetical protein Roseis2KO_17270 [Roseivirga sp.]
MEDHIEHNRIAEQRIISNVEEYGFHVALFEDDGYLPSFAYSIGLWKNFDHPEIIAFGLPVELLHSVICTTKTEIEKGINLQPGRLYTDYLEGYDIQFITVNKANYPDYLGYARWFNGSYDFPVLQLIWPDKDHKWPWEEGFNENWRFKQPLLDRNMDFKFHESKNQCIYTTHHALEGKPILYVFHDEDGSWQFHTEYDPEAKDAKLLCFEDIIKLDPTLNEVYHIGYAMTAYRDEIGGEWTIEDNKEEEAEEEN